MRTVLLAYLVVIVLALIGSAFVQAASAGPLTSTCHTYGTKC